MAVYFIQRGWSGPIKIGTASDPYARLAALQTGSPSQLRLIGIVDGGYELEHELHAAFAAVRILGEWFQPCKELTEYVGDRLLDIIYTLNNGTRKQWRDITIADLRHIDESNWERVHSGRATMEDYDDWRGFYSPMRTVLDRFSSVGDAVAAGAFEADESERRAS